VFNHRCKNRKKKILQFPPNVSEKCNKNSSRKKLDGAKTDDGFEF
jgi:hypothetical protein